MLVRGTPPTSVPSFVGAPAIFIRVHCIFFGRRSSALAMSPLENRRAGSAPKADSANTPGWNFLCLLLFLFAVNWVWAVDPSRHISQYGHTAWRIQDGFLSGAAVAVTQTTDGYLWIGTRVGLVRFDGVRFVPWTPPDGTHLPSSSVASLLGARDGSLWIGTEGGLSHWDKQHLTNYLIRPERIGSIIEDRHGTVWFTRTRGSDADGGLCQIIGTGMRCYGKADGLPGSNVASALVAARLITFTVPTVFPATTCWGSMRIVKAICGWRRPMALIVSVTFESQPFQPGRG